MDRCNECVNSYYRKGSKCVSCQPGAVCLTSGVTLANLVTEPGWYRFDPAAEVIYECPSPRNCVGGSLLNNSRRGCAVGASGPLCSRCEDDFYLDAIELRCVLCSLAVEESDGDDAEDDEGAQSGGTSNIAALLIAIVALICVYVVGGGTPLFAPLALYPN